jgi:hypothetical protein
MPCRKARRSTLRERLQSSRARDLAKGLEPKSEGALGRGDPCLSRDAVRESILVGVERTTRNFARVALDIDDETPEAVRDAPDRGKTTPTRARINRIDRSTHGDVNRRPTWFGLRKENAHRNRTTRRLPVPPRDGHGRSHASDVVSFEVSRGNTCSFINKGRLHDDGSSCWHARATWSRRGRDGWSRDRSTPEGSVVKGCAVEARSGHTQRALDPRTRKRSGAIRRRRPVHAHDMV